MIIEGINAYISKEVLEGALEALTDQSNLQNKKIWQTTYSSDTPGSYYTFCLIKSEEINQFLSSELAHLVNEIYQKILEAGLQPSTSIDIDIRFEKGCFVTEAAYWHQDHSQNEEDQFISICFSDRPEWTTKIVSLASEKAIGPLPLEFFNKSFLDKLESVRENTKIGFLYDVKRLVHRGPKYEDLNGPIDSENYRLFIRYNKRVDWNDNQ